MKVRANSSYRFVPVPWDIIDPPYGVEHNILKPGDIVKVVNLPGCPKANTMGHCHIEVDGQFAGMVHTNSLQRSVGSPPADDRPDVNDLLDDNPFWADFENCIANDPIN